MRGSKLFNQYPRLEEAYNVAEDQRIETKLFAQFGQFARESISALNIDVSAKTFAPANLAQNDPLRQALLMIAFLLEERKNYELSHYEFDLAKNALHKDALEAILAIERQGSSILDDWWVTIRDAKSFGEIQAFVDAKVFPFIEKLLKNNPKKSDQGDEEGKGKSQYSKNRAGAKPGQAQVTIQSDTSGGLKAGTGSSPDRAIPIPDYKSASALMRPFSDTLANRLLDVLKEKKAVTHSGLYKRGKLLSRNITKLMTNEERMFSRRNNPDTPDYKVYVVIDRSGSMDEEQKISYAYLAGVMVYDTALKMKMPVEVVSFNEDVEYIADNQNRTPDFEQFSTSGGTDDANMVRELADKVKKDQEETLVFIIGDGEGTSLPSASLAYLQKKGFLMGIGVGEGTERVAEAYPNGVTVASPKDVPKVIIQTLRGLIKR